MLTLIKIGQKHQESEIDQGIQMIQSRPGFGNFYMAICTFYPPKML